MATPVTYKVIDQQWAPSDSSIPEAMLNQVGQDGWQLITAYPDPIRERTRWIFSSATGVAGSGVPEAPTDGTLYGRLDATWVSAAPLTSPALAGVPTGPTASAGDNTTQLATTAFTETAIADLSGTYMRWVPYTGPPQSFNKSDMTRDGDWTMAANKATSDRPAPQPAGAEEDLLPAWTPTTQQNRASYTVYNEWTLSQAGWIDQYGVDFLNPNLGATHAVTLTVNGVVQDTFTVVPTAAGEYFQNLAPVVVSSGAVVRVTLQLTQLSNNNMAWEQQAGLFATSPTYCSLATGSKDGAAAGTTAYGCHLLFIPGTTSPDWDIVAFGGGSAAGGGIPDAPQDGTLYGRLNAAWSPVPSSPSPSSTTPAMDGIAAVGTGTTYARADHVHPSDTSRAPLASPAFTGTPTAPTVATADSTTTLATTAFVHNVAASAGVVAVNFYAASQTITIPAGTSKAMVIMWGATGGSGGVPNAASPGSGAGGYLEKFLTGLTPGSTLIYTQGAAGQAGTSSTAGGNGGVTTLASGTQSIGGTLTCNGSNGSPVGISGGTTAGSAGGTATGGDINIAGQPGESVPSQAGSGYLAAGGANFFSVGARGVSASSATAGNPGNPGGLKIMWYA